MYNRKKQLVILLVLVCLVGTMSIAYAVLSTTLNINGTAQVQDASWNIHFDNIQVNPYSVSINPVITDSNKVTFSADLTTPGDFYKFTVDIVNEGSIDAMIESIAKTPELSVEQKKYLRYEVEYVDGTSINDAQLLKSGETKTISVLFSYRNDIPVSDLPNTETDLDLEIVLVYVQANNTGVEISGNEKVVKVVSGDLNTVGSEICIGEECFYLISSDEYSVTMFAKYNLYVGGNYYDTGWSVYGEEATGMQDSKMKGWRGTGKYPYYGTTAFSTIDSAYSGSIVEGYVNNYKILLESNFKVEIEQARLITYDELINPETFGCVDNSVCNNTYTWLYSTSVWSGSAYDSSNIWNVNSIGQFNYNVYDKVLECGVRPVIVLSKIYF